MSASSTKLSASEIKESKSTDRNVHNQSKLIISCRMMHDLIKRVMSYFID